MSDKPLHILLVEDEVAHAELVQRAFEVYGERACLSVARTLAEARTCLASDPLRPDLIIADWRLPDGDGMELLPPEGDQPATPVVIMTSYGDERVAVEAMKAGALDYMVKSETMLMDMPHIAERAIREWTMLAERARIESELRESEARFRSLVEQSSDGITLLDEQGAIIEWNLANEKITGLRRDQVLGRPIGQVQLELAPERDGRRVRSERMKAAMLETLRLGPQSALGSSFEVTYQCADNSRRIVQQTVFPVKTDSGFRVGVISHDVTERKRVEKALEQRALELAALNNLGQRVGATLLLDLVVLAAIESIAGPTQSDLAMIFLREDDRLVLRGMRPQDSRFNEAAAHRLGECLCGLAASAGKPVFSDDIHSDPRCVREECKKAGLSSFAALPLHSGDEVLGVLGLAWATERDFVEQVSFLETMASQIASACQNALLHDKVQRHAAELEKRVAERTAQWQLANKELEAFAYSVSHDLRAPLRAIDGFSRLVLQDHGPQLPPEAQRDLHKVRSSAQRMGQLIDDLLAFSRLSRQSLNKRPVAPQDLVRQALFDLQSDQEGRQVEVVISELPTCQGDAALLRQVWINLLSNALKFTQGRAPARIEVGCIEKDGEQVYFVRDNGVGFDMQYAAKLFGVFQRLHSVEEYEGTGVGLAIVQRIIHRHGGRIWAEAQVDQGATFYFTL